MDTKPFLNLWLIGGLVVLTLIAGCTARPASTVHATLAVPATPAGAAMTCSHLVTPEQVGDGPYTQFGMAEKLEEGRFQRYESGGYVLCHYKDVERTDSSPLPVLDVRYVFHGTTGKLVLTHIESKNDAGARLLESHPLAPQCVDYVTPERIGPGVFERYGIAGRLQNGEFLSMASRGLLHCLATRKVGGIEVLEDEFLYTIDLATGELSFWRIHWREDLSEPIPPARISREKAEARAGGLVQGGSHLHLISPDDSFPFRVWPGASPDPDSVYHHPCWFIWSLQGGRMQSMCTTVIDAATGQLVRRDCGPER